MPVPGENAAQLRRGRGRRAQQRRGGLPLLRADRAWYPARALRVGGSGRPGEIQGSPDSSWKSTQGTAIAFPACRVSAQRSATRGLPGRRGPGWPGAACWRARLSRWWPRGPALAGRRPAAAAARGGRRTRPGGVTHGRRGGPAGDGRHHLGEPADRQARAAGHRAGHGQQPDPDRGVRPDGPAQVVQHPAHQPRPRSASTPPGTWPADVPLLRRGGPAARDPGPGSGPGLDGHHPRRHPPAEHLRRLPARGRSWIPAAPR